MKKKKKKLGKKLFIYSSSLIPPGESKSMSMSMFLFGRDIGISLSLGKWLGWIR